MRIKTKLLAGASTLAVAGSMMVAVAPAAHAVVTTVGSCTGSVSLIKLASPVKGVGLGDQTTPIKLAGNLAKDQVSHLAVNGGGSCTGVTRTGDTHVPQLGPLSLTAKSAAVSLLGNASCAQGAAIPSDATAATAYPLNGKITYTFNQTYTDLLNAHTVPYKMQADIGLLGFNPGFADVVDVGGIILSGVNAGATVSGSIWEDPVLLDHGVAGFNTGYDLDLVDAGGCITVGPGDANILAVLTGGGGASSSSLLGSLLVPGITFTFGEV